MTGTGKDGPPRQVYLYHVVDNAWSMREYGSQAVVWQTAINPVIALELLATGTWHGTGVLGTGGIRRACRSSTCSRLRLALGHGRPDRELDASALVVEVRRQPAGRGVEVPALSGRVLLELIPTDPAKAEVGPTRAARSRTRSPTRPGSIAYDSVSEMPMSRPPGAARRACPSRCGRGRPGSRAPAGCPGSARR